MSLYLQLHFDPDISEHRLKPNPTGKNNLHNLGYVQNVHAGQLLAELLPLSAVKQKKARFILAHPQFPLGKNTHIDPENPHRLLASTAGYVSFEDDIITVHSVLKILSDISFHTGNIVFYGDTAINGNVRAGFEVHGQNVLIHGMVEGGIVRAQKALTVTGGVRGGVSKHCSLSSIKDTRVAFTEKVEIQCYSNITVEKNCMHSTLYIARNALIKGRLSGGTLHGRQGVFVAEQLGNSAAVPTRIFLGYDPMRIRSLEKIDTHLQNLVTPLRHLTAVAGHLPPQANELSKKLYKARKKQAALIKARNYIWENLQLDEEHMRHCKVIVLGKVFPGVEIAIGQAYMQVDKPCQCVVFSAVGNDIICTPYTPPKQKND